jgi:predicted dehydrogenase
VTRSRLAVIGAGHLGRIHARLLAEMSQVELVGVADPLSAARDKVAADCGTTAFADYRSLVGRLDGAIVATPTRTHHAVALDFLRHGVPVFIEKPMAADLSEAEDLLRASRVHGVLVQVGHIERFNPAFTAAAARLHGPRYIEAVRASTFTGRSTDIGVVHDLMIHDIDLALSLAASPVARVSAMGVALLGRHEDVAQARLEFENGCVAHLSASRASFAMEPKRQMQVWSESGFAVIDFGNRSAHFVRPSEEVREHRVDFETLSAEEKACFKDRLFCDLLPVEMLDVPPRNALADELQEFVAGIQERQPVRVTADAGRAAVAVAESILNSIRTHSWSARPDGPVGPLAAPEPSILRGPHWHAAPETRPVRREAG